MDIFTLEPLNGIDLGELIEVTVDQIQHHLEAGAYSSLELTEWCLRRIEKTNPFLSAVTDVNPDAQAIASALDEERKHGHIRGPLHGIPILVKDNMATKDKMQTTAGCNALIGSIVPRDANVVRLLRNAGAIIIGHASMSEWASIRSSDESMGYSARGGQVRNPYNLSMSAWGSSSGSAAAVSAGIVPISYGTETDTSIISPAYYTGLVGIKPTVGLTSCVGVIPCSESQDAVGPFARNVRDAVYGLQAIVEGRSHHAHESEKTKKYNITDYTPYLSTKDALKGAVFGLPMKRVWNNVNEGLRPRYEEIFQMIRDAGAEIVEVDFPSWERMINEKGWCWNERRPHESEFHICAIEFYNGAKDYFAGLKNTSIRSLEDVIAWNNEHHEGAAPGDDPAFPNGHDLLVEVAELKGVKDETYYHALRFVQEQTREKGIDAALRYQPDPSKPAIQLDALIIADRKGSGQQMAAQAGYPIITIPVGVDKDEDGGRPFGLSFHQTAWGEAQLVKWASAVEDLLGGPQVRPRPKYKEHLATNIPITA